MADFVIKKGSTRPILTDTLTYSDGSTVSLAGATVFFVMRSLTGTAPITNLAASITSVTAPATVSYTFTATDTATAGQFMAEWHVTFADTSVMTFPTDGYLDILIEEDLVTPTQVGRLVSLGDAKAYLNIPSNDRTKDAELLRFIDGVTPVVESLTGPIIQRTYNEAYDGGVSRITLRHRPVVSVSSVTEYRGPVPYVLQQVQTPDQGTVYSYMFDPMGELIRRTAGGGISTFPPGYRQVYVTYTAGFATVPQNVRLATLELLRVNYQQTQQGGRPQYGGGGAPDDFAGYQMLGYFVPNRVRELLAPNRRVPRIA